MGRRQVSGRRNPTQVPPATTAGGYREVDLSAYEGEGMYIGVHDQPEGGGDMTAVCVAEGV